MTSATATEAIWHEVECGAYAADLPTWTALAQEAAGPVLELGAGTGRVCLELAGRGHEVTALDRSPLLLGELDRKARARGLVVETMVADARDFETAARFSLICAPMQLVHLLGGPGGRTAMLGRVAEHLAPGGSFAAALLAATADATEHGNPPLPDVLERQGWIYSSLPIEVRRVETGLEVRRLRQVVSPGGRLTEETATVSLDDLDPARFEEEALASGLAGGERLQVAASAEHVGSTICVLESGQ